MILFYEVYPFHRFSLKLQTLFHEAVQQINHFEILNSVRAIVLLVKVQCFKKKLSYILPQDLNLLNLSFSNCKIAISISAQIQPNLKMALLVYFSLLHLILYGIGDFTGAITNLYLNSTKMS